jgi:hypothetical protein
MNPYRRAALLFIRMVAFGFILLGLVYLVPDAFLAMKGRGGETRMGSIILKSVPVLFGIVIWIKSLSIARRLTEELDD